MGAAISEQTEASDLVSSQLDLGTVPENTEGGCLSVLPASTNSLLVPITNTPYLSPTASGQPILDHDGLFRMECYLRQDVMLRLNNSLFTLSSIEDIGNNLQLGNDPSFFAKYKKLDAQLNDVANLFRTVSAYTRSQLSLIDRSIEDIRKDVDKTGRWWEHVNILSDTFNDRSKMFHSHRFLSAPRDQSFASYLHKCMSQCPELFRSGRLRGQNDMVPFLLKEIPKLLHFNEDGANIALQLYLDLKIHVLPLKLHYRSGSYHDVIDKEVSKLLRDGRDSGTLEYHDLGWQCRRVREQMQTCPGADFNPEQFDERSCLREQHCHHNLLLPTLDTLQRHAYEQIHESVHLAVQSRLPPELQRMVFEYAMFSEEIPLDPRAIVHVEKIAHTTTNVPALVGSRPLLARSFCSHKDLFHYYLCDYYRMPNGTRVYWEPEWKATIPKFPHNDEVQWKQELRKLDYHMLR